MSTPYHAKLLALELTKKAEFGTPERVARALSDAQVDLNPHQVDAALFAARSPVSKGAVLADEVGLGKTIEAALLLGQRWAERRRKLLVIVPANLRKQWSQELMEKFHLPSQIVERRSIAIEAARGNFNPFNQDKIVIVSYPFAAKMAHYISHVTWDMVVIDEAHRLRNVYKPTSKHANAIKGAVAPFFKVLLTATPLQNSLMELYGLISVIDETYFGSVEGFREKYARKGLDKAGATALKERLNLVCKRTLRNDVRQFVQFTQRLALVQEFYHNPDEQRLYGLVSDYLAEPRLYALPKAQRQLMTMVLRKLLASSTFAISNTLAGLCGRLETLTTETVVPPELPSEITEDIDKLEEVIEEWEDEEDCEEGVNAVRSTLGPAELAEARHELGRLRQFLELARSIKVNSKGAVLVSALRAGFERAEAAQSAQPTLQRKAIIFTESRRTQEYLRDVLEAEDSPFRGKVVLFNGTNSDVRSKEIYAVWLQKHQGSDQISGSKSSDMRAALVDNFRHASEIMIATEAAAEGINLQFCNLVVNYDLPWNPQRIEQRIGRCHRYGQKCDVVVVNFVNKSNAADQRVYQLLQTKFLLFQSVFGASDEVLGLIDATGISFERRINEIYQKCRTEEQIKTAFHELEQELETEINQAKTQARVDLMSNFDQTVVEKVRIGAVSALDSVSKNLWNLTRHMLAGTADFDEQKFRFHLKRPVLSEELTPVGIYELKSNNLGMVHLYRIGHPLAEHIMETALAERTPTAEISFNLSGSHQKHSSLERFRHFSGWLVLTKLSFSFKDGQAEDHLILSAVTDGGEALDQENARALFHLAGKVVAPRNPPGVGLAERLRVATADAVGKRKASLETRNDSFLKDEMYKLEAWEDDQRAKYRIHYTELEKKLMELNRAIALCRDLSESLQLQEKKIRMKAGIRSEEQRYQVECALLEEKKHGLLQDTKARLQQTVDAEDQFTIRWSLA